MDEDIKKVVKMLDWVIVVSFSVAGGCFLGWAWTYFAG